MQVHVLFIGIEKSDFYLTKLHSQEGLKQNGQYNPNRFSQVTIDFQEKVLIGKKELLLKVWNPSGQEGYVNLRKLALYSIHAMVIAYDTNEQKDIELLKSYYKQVRGDKLTKKIKLYLLPKKYQSHFESEQVLRRIDCSLENDPYTQILTEEDDLFERIGRNYIQQQEKIKMCQQKCCSCQIF